MLDTVAPTLPTKLRRYQPRPGMVWIKGGQFRMGSDRNEPEEAPARTASVDGFWIDAMPVTNRQFSRFVLATDWLTSAERNADALERPMGPGGVAGPASLVFQAPEAGEAGDGWSFVAGADWRHPLGPASSLDGLDDHPVVHVSWDDISAYLAWSRTDLPTEAEWEYAARGGMDGATYAWGEELDPDGRRMANIWRGEYRTSTGSRAAGSAPHRSAPIRRTDTASSTWSGTSGNGPATGGPRPRPRPSRAAAVPRAIAGRGARTRATTPPHLAPRSPARC